MTLCAEPTPPNANPGDALPYDAIVETGPPPEAVADHSTAEVKAADPGTKTPGGVPGAAPASA